MVEELRTKAANRRCRHLYPAWVTTDDEDRRRARCLGCGQLGPPQVGLATALSTLRDCFVESGVQQNTGVSASRAGERLKF
jgi:hypothetical protein